MSLFIGIDPGVSTGYAVWDGERKDFLYLKTMTFWETIDELSNVPSRHEVTVVIEDPNLNKPVFFRPGQNQFMMQKISQNVGSNKRDAQLMIEWATRNSFIVKKIKPESAKWSDEIFKRLTKYTGRSSQHARDAAKLVFGL